MKSLGAKESKERLAWFNGWGSEIPLLIEKWKKDLPPGYSGRLDYTPNSLIVLGDFVLTHFENIGDLRESQNTFEALSAYIGEVFRTHLPDKPKWDVELNKLEDDGYYFYPYLSRKAPFTGFNPSILLPRILKTRDEKKIYSFFEKQLAVYEKKKDVVMAKPVPGRGGFNYQYFILVKNDSYTLSEVESTIISYYKQRGKPHLISYYNPNYLLVDMGSNYFFHLQVSNDPGVLQESKEIAESYKGEKDKVSIAQCKTRIEFWGDEDPNMDFFNDSLFILGELAKDSRLLIFDLTNGVFMDEV